MPCLTSKLVLGVLLLGVLLLGVLLFGVLLLLKQLPPFTIGGPTFKGGAEFNILSVLVVLFKSTNISFGQPFFPNVLFSISLEGYGLYIPSFVT